MAQRRRHDCHDMYTIWLSIPLPAIVVCKTLASCQSPPINWSNHAYLVSQRLASELSVQAKNVFLLYSSTRVTCRNTLLNDSDNRYFILQTCFQCQYYCVFCVFNLWRNVQNGRNHYNVDFGIFCQLILPPVITDSY